MFRKGGVGAEFFQGDARQPEQCAAAVKYTGDTFGALDILVNSDAGNFLAVSERLSPNGFKTVQEIDMGVFNMMSCAFEPWKASKFGGVVMNLSGALHCNVESGGARGREGRDRYNDSQLGHRVGKVWNTLLL